MDETSVNTRYGLILQGITSAALRLSGIQFRENWQYSPDCETPDFTIPDDDNPAYVVEVHATDVRESFRMKVFRLFDAVMDAKVFFGKEIVSVNLLFGNPYVELPVNNIRVLNSFFDINLMPGEDDTWGNIANKIQNIAFSLANNEEVDVNTAIQSFVRDQQKLVQQLSKYVRESIDGASPKEYLFPLWEKETTRIRQLMNFPSATRPTYYKRAIFQSLFLTDSQFDELIATKNPNLCSPETKDALIKYGLVTTKDIKVIGPRVPDTLTLTSELSIFIGDNYSKKLRDQCVTELKERNDLYWFFEDIRNKSRREQMINILFDTLSQGKDQLLYAFAQCLQHGNYLGIEHSRCWIADLLPLIVGESQNSFNRRMFRSPHYTITLANPYSNIVIRSPRLGNSPEAYKQYCQVAVDSFYQACMEHGIQFDGVDKEKLSKDLVEFRRAALIKLQKFNPLYIALESIAKSLQLNIEYIGVKTLLYDLAQSRDLLGKHDLYVVSHDNKKVLLNAVSAHDSHGDDKSKEWGARRRSSLYNFSDEQFIHSDYLAGVFVIDGEWDEKDTRRLYRSGWDYVIRLNELELLLAGIFQN